LGPSQTGSKKNGAFKARKGKGEKSPLSWKGKGVSVAKPARAADPFPGIALSRKKAKHPIILFGRGEGHPLRKGGEKRGDGYYVMPA